MHHSVILITTSIIVLVVAFFIMFIDIRTIERSFFAYIITISLKKFEKSHSIKLQHFRCSLQQTYVARACSRGVKYKFSPTNNLFSKIKATSILYTSQGTFTVVEKRRNKKLFKSTNIPKAGKRLLKINPYITLT